MKKEKEIVETDNFKGDILKVIDVVSWIGVISTWFINFSTIKIIIFLVLLNIYIIYRVSTEKIESKDKYLVVINLLIIAWNFYVIFSNAAYAWKVISIDPSIINSPEFFLF